MTAARPKLVVEGLDTVAEIRLNGALVLSAANQHRRWRVDVSAALRAGENEIAILFRSPVREAAARAAGMPFPIPYQQVNGPIPQANMLRKQQCDFGWDWNIALGIFGLSGAIRLEAKSARGLVTFWSRRATAAGHGRGRADGSCGL